MHPIWHEVVRSSQFKPDGPVRFSEKKEHINLKELNAALTAERRRGEAEPGTYYVHLQDSQVSLACLVKGRSSSWATNKKLRSSIPHHIGNNCKPFYGFVRSKLNPADDPTRGVELRKAAKAEETWYRDLAEGDCRGLDAFLDERNMGILDMAELPSEDELLQPWEFDVQTSKGLKAERGRNRGRRGAEEKEEAQQRGDCAGPLPDCADRTAEDEKEARGAPNEEKDLQAPAEGRSLKVPSQHTVGGLHPEATRF